jgi:PAS domain S-box-containing protein
LESLVFHQDVERFQSQLSRLWSSGIPIEQDLRFVEKDGTIIALRTHLSNLPDRTGKAAHLLMSVTTIAEPKVERLFQRENEPRIQAILDSLDVEIALLDGDGKIVAVNPAWKEFSLQNGGDERSYLGANYLEVCHAAARDSECGPTASEVEQKLRDLLDGKSKEFTLEYPCHSNAVRRWFFLNATHLGQGTTGAIVSHMNVTQRKLAELAILDAEERLQSILNTTIDAIVTTDQYGVIESVNEAAEGLFGFLSEQLVGVNIAVLIPPTQDSGKNDYVHHLLESGATRIIDFGREVQGRRQDGALIPLDLSVCHVKHSGVFICFLRDISDRKGMQSHILDMVSTVQRSIGQELHDGIQQELSGLSMYACGIQQFLESASRSDNSGRDVWSLDEGHFALLRDTARKLLKGLQDTNQHVSALSHGIMPVEIDPTCLRTALQELATSVDCPPKIRCCMETSGLVTVPNTSIATNLYRIAQEAVNNAIRHSRANQITIQLATIGEEIVLEVTDNGIGFERAEGFRMGTSKSGIGLRIMDYRANSIGGVLQIERNPCGGSMVRCSVPAKNRGCQTNDATTTDE